MRWLVAILVVFITVLVGAYFYVSGIPKQKYTGWISGKVNDRLFSIDQYRPIFLAPNLSGDVPTYEEDYSQLWREFPIYNGLVPLPTRHPLFVTVPIVKTRGKRKIPDLGMIIYNSSGREISRVYTLPAGLYPDLSYGQELFKIPYVREIILSKDFNSVWKDMFSLKINPGQTKKMEEMVYDLYLLHLRSKLLPKKTLRYGLIKKGELALVELESENKDYQVELIMSQKDGMIFSYIIRTEKINDDSTKLRAKFLNSIKFVPVDEAMSKMIYTEFKQLNFARQVDQEGMLYLYSAWTQDLDNNELFREMIYYLERGRGTNKQLKVLYDYAMAKFGKTFSSYQGKIIDDNALNLQRSIEHEALKKKRELERESKPIDLDTDPQKRLRSDLKKAKERKTKKKGELTID